MLKKKVQLLLIVDKDEEGGHAGDDDGNDEGKLLVSANRHREALSTSELDAAVLEITPNRFVCVAHLHNKEATLCE